MKLKHVMPIMVFGFALLQAGCKKETADSGPKFRIKSTVTFNGAYPKDSSSIIYMGDQVKTVLVYNFQDRWLEGSKSELSYNGNTITKVNFKKIDNDWKPQSKIILTTENNYPKEALEYTYNNGQYVEYKKNTFLYQGGMLKRITNYDMDGSWVKSFETNLTYTSNRLSAIKEMRIYSTDKYYKVDTFLYLGGKISKVTTFYLYGSVKEYDSEARYTYSSDKLSTSDYYIYNSNEWKHDENVTFNYDTNNYLTEVHEVSDNKNYKEVYAYEPGSGNVANLMQFFDLTKLYGKPTIKSTEKGKGIKKTMNLVRAL